MRQEDLLQIRFNVLTNVTRMPRIMMERNNNVSDYDSDIAHLNDLEAVIEQLETIFNMDNESLSTILGGEFLPDEMERDNSLGVPLYLYIDIIINTLPLIMNDTAKLDERKNILLMRLKNCREKAAKLSYHPHFHAKKQLSKQAITKVLQAKGEYYFSIKQADNKKYLSIVSAINNRDEFAFQEDLNRVKMRESERYINHVIEIQNHIRKYFKNNIIPDSTNIFSKSLKDPSIPNSIRISLYTIVELLAHESNNTTITLDQAFIRLCKQETIVAKQQMEEKANNFAKQTLVEENHQRVGGIFVRYNGPIMPKANIPASPQMINMFEELRKKQILQDEETRNQVMAKIEAPKKVPFIGIRM